MSLFNVYVNGRHHLVIPDEENTFETQQNLEQNGFTLIWDSAPSVFAGAKYAARSYNAPVPVERKVV